MAKGLSDAANSDLQIHADSSIALPNNVLSVAKASVDPGLAALFQSSAGAVKVIQQKAPRDLRHGFSQDRESILKQQGSKSNIAQKELVGSFQVENYAPTAQSIGLKPQRSSRKRARNDDEDNLEESYLKRLAKEEAKEDRHRQEEASSKRQKTEGNRSSNVSHRSSHSISPAVESREEPELQDQSSSNGSDGHMEALPEDPYNHTTVQHESLAGSAQDLDIEKAARTVFIGNVCTSAIKSKPAKSTFTQHLLSFVSSLLPHEPAHKIESLRFRSTPFSTSAIPKKAAFVKKELMDATTKSTNAYVVYSSSLVAREAVKRLNGSVCLERHIRVDSVAHPSKTDHKRCVFVGNLGFVDNPQAIDAAEDEENQKKPRKPREPADIEEGLWRTFGRCGKVETVRVIRDPITRVGKGFAYVQFEDTNAVEKALLLAGKKFPPMLPRILRVTRAKNVGKTASKSREPKGASKISQRANDAIHVAKPDPQKQSLIGRAGKLFGRAGAAKLRGTGSNTTALGQRGSMKSTNGSNSLAATALVFEGYRASSAGKKGVKVVAKKGKPQNRSSKRAAAFKSGGFKTKQGKVREQRARGKK